MSPSKKTRLDLILVDRGLATSRHQAQALSLAGKVTVNGQRVDKPGHSVEADSLIEIDEGDRFVSRGGFKLEHALNVFDINVEGRTALDIGASTGGFTDCLIQRSVSKVYAVDVGKGQIHQKLRDNPVVVVMEKLNARNSFDLPESVQIVVIDVSFISLSLILPEAIRHMEPSGQILALVKPQFEAKPHQVGKGGIVRNPQTHAETISKVALQTIRLGLRFRGATRTPVIRSGQNREFFIWAQLPS
tara:strand:- start:3940 stop:4677 length:738 start_codon:yes stop_codon:yes gene_type:complete